MADPRDVTFYREVHVDDLGLAVRRLVGTALFGRCPACGRGRVTDGPFGVRDRCATCGSRFDRLEGNELIAIPLSFFLTVVALLAVALTVVPRFGFFDGLMLALFGVGTVLVLLLVRPVRVATLWFLWVLGFVYPDGVTRKGRTTLPRSPEARSAPDESKVEGEARRDGRRQDVSSAS